MASVFTSTKVSVGALLLGTVLALIGLASLNQGGVLWLILGGILLINCWSAVIAIQNNAGSTIRHRISIFNKGTADSFCEEVNTVIAGR